MDNPHAGQTWAGFLLLRGLRATGKSRDIFRGVSLWALAARKRTSHVMLRGILPVDKGNGRTEATTVQWLAARRTDAAELCENATVACYVAPFTAHCLVIRRLSLVAGSVSFPRATRLNFRHAAVLVDAATVPAQRGQGAAERV